MYDTSPSLFYIPFTKFGQYSYKENHTDSLNVAFGISFVKYLITSTLRGLGRPLDKLAWDDIHFFQNIDVLCMS